MACLRTVASYLHSSAGTWLYLDCGHRVLRDSWCPGTGRVPCSECAPEVHAAPVKPLDLAGVKLSVRSR